VLERVSANESGKPKEVEPNEVQAGAAPVVGRIRFMDAQRVNLDGFAL